MIARNDGVPLAALGAAKKYLAVSLAQVAVNVPELVTGELVTVNSTGRDNPTLVTVPLVAGAAHVGAPPVVAVNTWPVVPAAVKA